MCYNQYDSTTFSQFSLNGSHGGAVPLLPSRVPDLQICLLAIHQHPLHLEINPWEEKRKEKKADSNV